MTLKEFIRANRPAIDKVILSVCSNAGRIDDAERRLWVLNDEGLYWWAKREGVKV